MHGTACRRHHSRESAPGPGGGRQVPRTRLQPDSRGALFCAEGQTPARLHLFPGLQLPLRFCSDPFVYGRQWVGLEPTRMALRLKELWDQYHFDDVNFQDETFFTKRERVRALADKIVESGMKITWAATMRADQGVRLPDEVWAKCKQSGLRRLLVESSRAPTRC